MCRALTTMAHLAVDAADPDGDLYGASDRRLTKKKGILSVRAAAIKMGVLTHEVDEGSHCRKCGDACPGFSLHFWRKICKNCLCSRDEHDIGRQDPSEHGLTVGKILFAPTADTKDRHLSTGSLGDGYTSSPRMRRSVSDTSTNSPSLLKKKHNYSWVPKGSSLEVAQAYFKSLPANKTPIRSTPGERYRQKQLIKQLPAYDVDTLYCNSLTVEERKQMELFLRMRKEKCLGKGELQQRDASDQSPPWVCEECSIPLKVGEVALFAERAGPDKCWHPACFICSVCRELLVDLIYFYSDSVHKLYCGRHHAETVKPRCAACDEMVFCREYTRAEDQDWHLDHFCCLRCDTGLGGRQYRPHEGQPFCLPCYEIAFAAVCETCGNSITLDEPRLTHSTNYWHGTDECFKCGFCSRSLIEQPFLPRHGKVFCSKDHARKFKKSRK